MMPNLGRFELNTINSQSTLIFAQCILHLHIQLIAYYNKKYHEFGGIDPCLPPGSALAFTRSLHYSKRRQYLQDL